VLLELHAEEPAVDVVPAAQVAHEVAPALEENVPAGQLTQ